MRVFVIASLIIILVAGCSDRKENPEPTPTIQHTFLLDTIKTEIEVETELIVSPKGTQILHGSEKLFETRWTSGYAMMEAILTPCKNESGEPDFGQNNKIRHLVKTDTTFSIEFSIVENCCHDFLCEAEILDNNTLNLIYHRYGSQCSCYCCFGLQYTFKILTNPRQPKINPNNIKYVMIDGDIKTKTSIKNYNN